ncbi:MAG: GYF domain-containing protein [Planctomycetota bacterium]|nr:GYF domain-containing protein [Planctomycetota bacterium]
MTSRVTNGRWSVQDDDFAARIEIPDVKGFFLGIPKGRSLAIEPGTRAILIDDGALMGEVPPGSYVMESFLERLQFGQAKQATAILARSEDVVYATRMANIATRDNVCVDVLIRWSIQVSDVTAFLHNLMGARQTLTKDELRRLIGPIVRQGVYTTVGRMEAGELTSPELPAVLAEGIGSQIDIKLRRYGLSFVDVHAAECTSDAIRRTQDQSGENWLQTRESGLLQAAGEIENEQLQIKLADTQKKVAIRRELRDAVRSDRLAKVQSKEGFRKSIEELDRHRILRKDERDRLIASIDEGKQDGQLQRDHFLATLDIERERELAELREEMDFALQSQNLQHEIALSELTQQKESLKWKQQLQKEAEELAHRHQLKLESIKSRWEQIRESNAQKRDELLQALLHRQKVDDLKSDLELARAERITRIAIMESELNARLKKEKLEVEKRRQEWELELRDKKSTSQLDRLAKVQQLNADFAERQQRMQADIEILKADNASERELKRIDAMSGLGTEALIATTEIANAQALADLKKIEAGASHADTLNEERLRMYEKMNETERTKADAIADAYRTAMLAQQGQAPQLTPSPPGPPPLASWYVSLNGQQAGPMTMADIQNHIASGAVNAASSVWKTGMANWIPASQVGELSHLFNTAGPPGPPPS